MEPIRRDITVTEPSIVAHAVGPSRIPRVFLLQRHGEGAFERVTAAMPLFVGDVLRVWTLDYTRLQELQAANAAYNDAWYAASAGVIPWDDERRLIEAFVPVLGARVLEICCGTGRVTEALVRDGNDVVGLDLAAPSLAAAPGRARYVRGDAGRLPFADRAFDVGLCLENSLAEFLIDPLAPLVELIRVVRDGGTVVVSLREGPDPSVFWSPDGAVLVIRPFPEARRRSFLAAVERLDRVAAVRVRPGDERPWGGRVWHAAIRLGRRVGR